MMLLCFKLLCAYQILIPVLFGSESKQHILTYSYALTEKPLLLNNKPRSNGQNHGTPTKLRPGKNGVSTWSMRPLALERRKNIQAPIEAEAHIRDLQHLAQTLIESRERQQQDISRELHDNIAQVLAAATTRISIANEERMPAWLRQELIDLRDNLKAALEDVRHLARDLRPSLLDHCGFAAALDKHADAFRERTIIRLDLNVEPDAFNFLEPGNLTHLFRLTQEGLQNIEDHSGADQAWINVATHRGQLLLEIGDNGCGFTPARVSQAQADGHLGLLGMRERSELLGGQLVLETVPDQGTTIRVIIPPPAKSSLESIL
jgi:two-component system, NarL family, sensor histidine kinase UhpB